MFHVVADVVSTVQVSLPLRWSVAAAAAAAGGGTSFVAGAAAAAAAADVARDATTGTSGKEDVTSIDAVFGFILVFNVEYGTYFLLVCDCDCCDEDDEGKVYGLVDKEAKGSLGSRRNTEEVREERSVRADVAAVDAVATDSVFGGRMVSSSSLGLVSVLVSDMYKATGSCRSGVLPSLRNVG